jgi:hypothetical protein
MMVGGCWRSRISGLTAVAFSNLAAGSAYAICQATSTVAGSGPPSISATEASTAQALEILQRRKDDAASGENLLLASADAAEAAEGVAAGSATAPDAASSSAAPQGTQPKVAKVKKRASTGPDIAAQSQSVSTGGWTRTRGTWALAYADYERNGDVNIGLTDVDRANNPNESRTKDDVTVTRKQRSGGTLAGMDWTYMANGQANKGYQLGFFGGYDHTKSKFSDGSFAAFELTDDPLDDPNQRSEEFFERTGAKEFTDSGSVGLYGALFRGGWTLDTALKIDIADFEHEHTTRKLFCADQIDFKKAEVDYTDYVVSANVAYLYQISPRSWLQPIAGFRYTFTDFSTASGNLTLGAEDGNVLRLQGGLTWGGFAILPRGYVLSTTFTGLLYSDVLIDGFVGRASITEGAAISSLTAPGATLNDEGKLRVLGQLSSILDLGDGYSLIGQLEARGGNDYYGVGGRLGARYEW